MCERERERGCVVSVAFNQRRKQICVLFLETENDSVCVACMCVFVCVCVCGVCVCVYVGGLLGGCEVSDPPSPPPLARTVNVSRGCLGR